MRTASKVDRQSVVSHVLPSHKAEPIHRKVPAIRREDIRADKVAAVRAAIASGAYEHSFKLEIAIDKLLDELMAADFSGASKGPTANWQSSSARRIAPR